MGQNGEKCLSRPREFQFLRKNDVPYSQVIINPAENCHHVRRLWYCTQKIKLRVGTNVGLPNKSPRIREATRTTGRRHAEIAYLAVAPSFLRRFQLARVA